VIGLRCRLWIGGGAIFLVKWIEGPLRSLRGKVDEGKEVAAKKLDGLGPFVLVGLGRVGRVRAYVVAMKVECDDLFRSSRKIDH